MTAEGYPSGDEGEFEGSRRGGEVRHVSYMLDIEEQHDGSEAELHSELGDTGVGNGLRLEERYKELPLPHLGHAMEGGVAVRHGGAAASARKQKAQAIKSAVAVRKVRCGSCAGGLRLVGRGKRRGCWEHHLKGRGLVLWAAWGTWHHVSCQPGSLGVEPACSAHGEPVSPGHSCV